ncbi:MAG: hypothetical protein HRT53_05050 [Colwellia sp.]|nr:hypothetical protein [Colwellia sp.]
MAKRSDVQEVGYATVPWMAKSSDVQEVRNAKAPWIAKSSDVQEADYVTVLKLTST